MMLNEHELYLGEVRTRRGWFGSTVIEILVADTRVSALNRHWRKLRPSDPLRVKVSARWSRQAA